MRFLIVEDDALSAELLRIHLSAHGTCYIAPNGLMAAEVVRAALEDKDPFDAIFLDIMMPQMNGHEVLEAIRAEEKERGLDGTSRTKIIMVTALGDANSIMGAVRHGCDGYIVKPLREENLLKELTKLGLLQPA
jgi:two-component system, chemotaxis family, chemotaxis protein CheY